MTNEMQDLKTKLSDLLNCQICYDQVKEPMMCPFCSKLFCRNCMAKFFSIKAECPNCRQKLQGMTDCARFVNQITELADLLIQNRDKEDFCGIHQIEIRYYCQHCQIPVCCECGMFGTHKDHHFVRLEVIYKQHYEHVRSLLSSLKEHISTQEHLLKEESRLLKMVNELKEQRIMEIDVFFDQLKPVQTAHENEKAQSYEEYIAEVVLVEKELRKDMENTKDYKLKEELEEKAKEVISKRKKFNEKKSKEFLAQIIPLYESFTYKISHLEDLTANTITTPMYYIYGGEWKVIVHPKGIKTSEYISVFIQCVKSVQSFSISYDCAIELLHPKDINLRKEQQTKMKSGDSFGYANFVEIASLKEYLINKQLIFKIEIRPAFYYDVCKGNEEIIKNLEQSIEEQNKEIEELEQKHAEISTCEITDKNKQVIESPRITIYSPVRSNLSESLKLEN